MLPILFLAASALRCNLNALDPEERALHGKATRQLAQSIRQRVELDRGYRLQFNLREISAAALVEWISHERRCCPFLRFDLQFDPEQGPVWLSLTGPEGAKEILKGAFSKPKD